MAMGENPSGSTRRRVLWKITAVIAIALVVATAYQFVIFPWVLKSHQNQQYEYVYSCNGVPDFESQTTVLTPDFSVNDSMFGEGYFSVQLNVQTMDGLVPGPAIQAIALVSAVNLRGQTVLEVQEWQSGNLLLNLRSSISPFFSITRQEALRMTVVQNNAHQYSGLLALVMSNGASYWSTSLNFTTQGTTKMVEAESGVYGLGNASKAIFAPSSIPLFSQSVLSDAKVRSSMLGDDCGDGQYLTLESSNLLLENVTGSQNGIEYDLNP